MILINYDIGMIILHEHNGHGTSQAELQLDKFYIMNY